MLGYWDIPKRCRECRKKRIYDASGYKCYCLPYWGKVITLDINCPKDMKDGGSLKSICQVNTN